MTGPPRWLLPSCLVFILLTCLFVPAGSGPEMASAQEQTGALLPWKEGTIDPGTGIVEQGGHHVRTIVSVSIPEGLGPVQDLPVQVALDVPSLLAEAGFPARGGGGQSELIGFDLDPATFVVRELSGNSQGPRLPVFVSPGDFSDSPGKSGKDLVTLRWIAPGETRASQDGSDNERRFVIYYDSVQNGPLDDLPTVNPADSGALSQALVGPGPRTLQIVPLAPPGSQSVHALVTNMHEGESEIRIHEFPGNRPSSSATHEFQLAGQGTSRTLEIAATTTTQEGFLLVQSSGPVLVEGLRGTPDGRDHVAFLPSTTGGYTGHRFLDTPAWDASWKVYCPQTRCDVTVTRDGAPEDHEVRRDLPLTLQVSAGSPTHLVSLNSPVMVKRVPGDLEASRGFVSWPPMDGPSSATLYMGEARTADRLHLAGHAPGTCISVLSLPAEGRRILDPNLCTGQGATKDTSVGWGMLWERNWPGTTHRPAHETGSALFEATTGPLTLLSGSMPGDGALSAAAALQSPDGGHTYRFHIPEPTHNPPIGTLYVFSPYRGATVQATNTPAVGSSSVHTLGPLPENSWVGLPRLGGDWSIESEERPVVVVWRKIGQEPFVAPATGILDVAQTTVEATEFASYAASVRVAPSFVEVRGGQQVTFTATVTNHARDVDGNGVPDSFTLSASVSHPQADDWQVEVSPSTLELGPDESNSQPQIRVRVPPDATPGDVARLGVTATSMSDDRVQAGHTAILGFRVVRDVQVLVDGARQTERQIATGESIDYRISVRNAGTSADAYDLSVTSPSSGWNVTFRPEMEGLHSPTRTDLLEPAEEAHYTLTVETDEAAGAVGRLVTNVLARSASDARVADAARIVTSVDRDRLFTVDVPDATRVVAPGETTRFTVRITNEAEVNEDLNITQTGTRPQGWEIPQVTWKERGVLVEEVDNLVNMPPGGSATLLIDMEVPEDAPPFTLVQERLRLRSQFQPDSSGTDVPLRVVVDRVTHFEAELDPSQVSLVPGENATVNLQLRSLGNDGHSVKIDPQTPPGAEAWSLRDSDGRPPPWNVDLAPGEKHAFPITVNLPSTTPTTVGQESSLVRIALTAQGQNARALALGVNVLASHDLQIGDLDEPLLLPAGWSSPVRIALVNNGNEPVDLAPEWSDLPDTWSASASSLRLVPGEATEIESRIHIPLDAASDELTVGILTLIDPDGEVVGQKSFSFLAAQARLTLEPVGTQPLGDQRSYRYNLTNEGDAPAYGVAVELVREKQILDRVIFQMIAPGRSHVVVLVGPADVDGVTAQATAVARGDQRASETDSVILAAADQPPGARLDEGRSIPAPALGLIVAIGLGGLAARFHRPAGARRNLEPLWGLIRFAGRHWGLKRLRMAFMAPALVLVLLGAGMAALMVTPGTPGWEDGFQERVSRVEVAGDTAGNGLPDAVENRIGSDPARFDTLGGGVADGWLYEQFGDTVDWSDPSLLDRPILKPPNEELPAPLRHPGAFPLPTVRDLYEKESSWRDPTGERGAWWLVDDVLRVHRWDNTGDGIADAWLMSYDLDPYAVEADGQSPGDPSMSLREKYESGLDPTKEDTSGNGLKDREELDGFARFGSREHRFTPTDPRAFSTSGSDIADGYLVRFALDPHDPQVASSSPAGDGVTVREAFNATRAHCERDLDPCAWRERLEDGPLVDPTIVDSNGDGVPDAWSIRDPHGLVHPLDDAGEVVLYTTHEWDEQQVDIGDPDARGVVVDALNPVPDEPFVVTAYDAYRHLRPSDWNEETDGPWWGGLPTQIEGTDKIPPAVALRGWDIRIHTGLGPDDDSQEDRWQTLRATADPRREDTTGSGLLDIHQYLGVLPDGTWVGRTNPADPDTSGDGLPDHEEIFTYGTDPLRRDSSGSFLMDGEEVEYWTARFDEAIREFEKDPDLARENYAFLASEGSQVTAVDLERLLPTGMIHGDQPNVLSASSSGDSLLDGQELFPNRFLPQAGSFARPATDPARTDTSGDGLPDEWKVRWSMDEVFNCRGPCNSPLSDFSGWPLDPSKRLSMEGISGVESDYGNDLSGDDVQVAQGASRGFTNGLAYRYDLNPFLRDTSGDGIRDMFAIHWGIEAVPGFVQETIGDQGGSGAFAWAASAADRLSEGLVARGYGALESPVVIDPTRVNEQVGLETNLLGLFSDREKGTWVYELDASVCNQDPGSVDVLPSQGPRRETEYRTPDSDKPVPGRAGLEAGGDACWIWIDYPIAADQVRRTNPWKHAFVGGTEEFVIPDAWRQHYHQKAPDLGLLRAASDELLPSSIHAGCRQAQFSLPEGRDSWCISLGEAYKRGLDPTVADTDGGGLPDWEEIALGLDPLDPEDDFGDADWTGNWILNIEEGELGLNRLAPDTSRSGLLDSDHEGLGFREDRPFSEPGMGEGHLCLPEPDSAVADHLVPNMNGRPQEFGGPLKFSELYDLYIQAGVVHLTSTQLAQRDATICSALDTPANPHTVFFREGHVNLVKTTGGEIFREELGFRTDPRLQDTTGDGIPDGWLVYWLLRHGGSESDLDPGRSHATRDSPDGIGGLLEAYERNRPDDWDEQRDGIWWGGLNPLDPDTAGDAQWFVSGIEWNDRWDVDLDSDGIPDGYDPFPSIDTHNTGVVQWDATSGRYVTDQVALWQALEDRHASSLVDRDNDRVPDFLDRARVAVELHEIPDAVERGEPFHVSGRVLVDETNDGLGAYGDFTSPHTDWASTEEGVIAVHGATAKLILVDQDGRQAVAGIGFTDPQGRFNIHGSATGTVTIPEPPFQSGHAAGVLLGAGESTISTGAGFLEPGTDVDLFIMVEANDPGLHPLEFVYASGENNGAAFDHVLSFKQHPSGGKFRLPMGLGEDDPRLEHFVLDDSLEQPDSTVSRAMHATNAVFHGESDRAQITLSAPSQIDLDPFPSRILQGEGLWVNGTLHSLGTPLTGRTVEAGIGGDMQTATTNDEGRFSIQFGTQHLTTGIHVVAVNALMDEAGKIAPPDTAVASAQVSKDLDWQADSIRIDGDAQLRGIILKRALGARLEVEARLLDHWDEPVADKKVLVSLQAVESGQRLHDSVVPTGTDGVLRHEVPVVATTDRSAEDYLLRFVPERSTQGDGLPDPELVFTVRPQLPTVLELEEVDGEVGINADLRGVLRIEGGGGVHDAQASFVVRSSDGASVTFQGTDADGRFEFPVHADRPLEREYTVVFIGSDTDRYAPSEPARTTARFQADTLLEWAPLDAQPLRSEPVAVRAVASFIHPELGLRPLQGAKIEAGWVDDGSLDPVESVTNTRGVAHLILSARDEAGDHEAAVTLPGDGLSRAYSAMGTLRLHVMNNLTLQMQDILLRGGEHHKGSWVSGTLTDDEGRSLAGRTVWIHATEPAGNQSSHERRTDSQGRFHLDLDAIPGPVHGLWRIDAQVPPGDFELEAVAQAEGRVHFELVVEIVRHPLHTGQGEEMEFKVRVLSPGSGGAPVDLVARFNDGVVGQGHVLSGDEWVHRFTVPPLLPGPNALNVTGHAEGLEVRSDQVQINVTKGIHLELIEHPLDGGGRLFEVVATSPTNQSLEGLELVLARMATDDSVLGQHEVRLDAAGRGEVRLSAVQQGEIVAVSLRDPDARFLSVQQQPFEFTVTTDRSPILWWIIAAVALMVAGFSLWAYYQFWHRDRRLTLAELFAEAYRKLLAETAPEEVVYRAYEQLVGLLRASGYEAKEAETARDLAHNAIHAFHLPSAPMQQITRLMEQVVYGKVSMVEADRQVAIVAFDEVAKRLQADAGK